MDPLRGMRKYLSEFALNMCTDGVALAQEDGLAELEDLDAHIYFICRQPRVSIVPESLNITDDEVTGVFLEHKQDQRIEIPFRTRNLMGTSNLKVVSRFPYAWVSLVNQREEPILSANCALLAASLGVRRTDLEVLYIGQSYGEDGKRRAGERLRRHETLQRIYAEALRRSPDQEIWLVLSAFMEVRIVSFDPTRPSLASPEEDDIHLHDRILGASVSEQQRINFAEAALIRYFQPEYNKVYKGRFPNPAHSTYSDCYDLDVNTVMVEMQTEQIGARLWSPTVAPSELHFCVYPLHSREERWAIFDF